MTHEADLETKDSPTGSDPEALQSLSKIRTGLDRYLLGIDSTSYRTRSSAGGLLNRDFLRKWLETNKPSFLDVRWLEENLFISSQRLSKLRSIYCEQEPSVREQLLDGVEKFVSSGDRRSFIELFLANWPEPYFSYSVATATSQSHDEMLAEVLRPLRKRLSVLHSPSLYETGDYSFAGDCISRAHELICSSASKHDGIQLMWMFMILSPFTAGEIELVEDLSTKHLLDTPDGRLLFEYAKLRSDTRAGIKNMAGSLAPELSAFSEPNRGSAPSMLDLAGDDIEDQIDSIASWAEWFDHAIDWTERDFEVLRSFAPDPLPRFGHVEAASLLATKFMLFQPEQGFSKMVDAVLAALDAFSGGD